MSFADALRASAEALPCPWESLRRLVRITPGSLVLLSGAPGSFKSMVSLSWALSMEAPTLYVSLDTADHTQAIRVISYHTGHTTSELEEQMIADPEAREKWALWFEDWERSTQLRLLTLPVTAKEVGDAVKAWTEYWGVVPSLVIVDDMESLAGEKDYKGFLENMVDLARVAKEHETVVIGIQHNGRGEHGDGTERLRRPHLSGMKWGGEYQASHVIGAWRPEGNKLRLSILKNRTGEDASNGTLYAQLFADPSRVQIRDERYGEWAG